MSYIEQTLTPGETLIARANFSWLFLALSIVPFFLGLFAIYILVEYAVRSFGLNGPLFHKVVRYGYLIVFLIGAGKYFSICLPWVYTEIAITSRRIIYKRGLVSRQVDDVDIRRVQGVNLDQSIIGRIFNYGSLIIFGTGIDQIMLPPISDPLEFRKAIQEAVNELHTQDAPYNP